MVVDDEKDIRELTCQFLTMAGYRVDVFADGSEAFQALAERPHDWDLLLTDQTMPRMTGCQLAKKAKAIRHDLPVILCSGYKTIESKDKTVNDGVSIFLQKPVDRCTLLTNVAKALSRE